MRTIEMIERFRNDHWSMDSSEAADKTNSQMAQTNNNETKRAKLTSSDHILNNEEK
jgi:hypothetical protein